MARKHQLICGGSCGQKKTPDADWTLCGVRIGTENFDMMARGLLALGQALEGDAMAVIVNKNEQLWMAPFCAVPFRLHTLGSGLRANYKQDITTRILDYLDSLVQMKQCNPIVCLKSRAVGTRSKKSKLVAAIDSRQIRAPDSVGRSRISPKVG